MWSGDFNVQYIAWEEREDDHGCILKYKMEPQTKKCS